MFERIKAIPFKPVLILVGITGLTFWLLNEPEDADEQVGLAPPTHMLSNALASETNARQGDILTVEGSQISSPTIVGGTVIPARDVTLTAQLSGQVNFIAGREGDRFNQDTILIGINADQLTARRQATVALLQNAQAEINNAQVQYQRELLSPQSLSLSKSGGMGLPMLFDQMFSLPLSTLMPGTTGGDTVLDRSADLYTVSTRVNQAQGRYMQIKSQIDEIDADISDSRIHTPFPGIILEKMVEPGDTVQVGTPLLRYADLSHLQIEAQVPASIVTGLSTNMIISVRLGEAKYESYARIEQIFPTADAQRRTVTVKFDLPKTNRAIPGMYVELFLPGNQGQQDPVPVIPTSAVMFNASLPTVRLMDQQGQLKLRMIRLGERLPNKKVVVISGLRIGERILSQP